MLEGVLANMLRQETFYCSMEDLLHVGGSVS